jgi:ABC-type dipeptide/oligopeptide/nickel transport system permease component
MTAITLIVRRLLHGVVVLVGAVTLAFFLVRVVPGDPATLLLSPEALPETIEAMRHYWGLDQPIYVQYVRYLGQVLRGDMGLSIRFRQPVTDLLLNYLPATIELSCVALTLAIVVGIPAGVVAALKAGSRLDTLVTVASLVGQSVPTFWLGIVLIIVVAIPVPIIPTSGRGTVWHLMLPSLTLSTYIGALIARLTRSYMSEVLTKVFVRTAHAKGLSKPVVLIRHAFRNALVPISTVIGLQMGTLLGGAAITEAVFGWPGVGTLAINAIKFRDYGVVQAVVLLAAVSFVSINTALEILYPLMDPRIRHT